MTRSIRFHGERSPVLAVADGANLCEALTTADTPVLFGCRTGICGSCLVEVDEADVLPPPDDDEREVLELVAPGNRRARLACQVRACLDLTLTALEPA